MNQGLTDYQRQMKAESIAVSNERDTVYQRRMRDLARRTLLVPTDSLARLYAMIPRTLVADLWRIRQAMGCVHITQMSKHGAAAYKRATNRMVDSLERTGFDVMKADDVSLSAPGPLLTFAIDNCGENLALESRVPDSLSNYPERTAARPR
ncbi:MAG: hypothetical protein ABIT20_18430 [Gemmatimonadaceae bacterium]